MLSPDRPGRPGTSFPLWSTTLPSASCGALLAFCLLGLALLSTASCSSGEDERWNVVVVTLDTTRSDYVSCYGKRPKAKTPTMDALAAEGVRMENSLSVCSVTPVSHASILTGLYQYRHGLRVIAGSGGFHLPEEVPHLGEILKNYKWHTIAVHSAFPVSSYFGFDRAFDRFDSVETSMADQGDGVQQWDWKEFQRRSDDTIDRAIKYVGEAGDDPFFLWLHLWDPHDMGKLPPDEYIEANDPDPDWRKKWPRSKRWHRRYEVEVQYMDEQLGRLVQHLKDQGSYDRTLFVITSDHGEGLGEHNWMAHRLVYQEQLEVPLILKWPGGPAGKVVSGVASGVDVLPTVLDAMGIPFDAETLDGISLLEAIEAGRVPDRITYADQINGYDTNAGMVQQRPRDDFLYSVSDGRWKLIWRPSYPHLSELFDLQADPDEEQNLFNRELEPQRRLVRDLVGRFSWVTKPIEPDANRVQTEEARQALAQLGYAGGAEQSVSNLVHRWAWGCAEHLEVIESSPENPCPKCGEPLLMRTVTPVDQLPPK